MCVGQLGPGNQNVLTFQPSFIWQWSEKGRVTSGALPNTPVGGDGLPSATKASIFLLLFAVTDKACNQGVFH